ncbi:MAG: hypothetical protein HY788_10690 [Deltaproteobacteria bacterium]|nr:hypothetical protein [Deltaproteobacteria bacterium]
MMYARRPTWMGLAAFLVFVLISSGVSVGPARAEDNPKAISAPGLGADRIKSALFAAPGRRGTLDWSDDLTVNRSRFVDVKTALLSGAETRGAAALPAGAVVDLNLFDDVEFPAVLERLDPLASGGFTWVGRLENVDRSLVTLVVENDIVMGNIALPGGVMYQVRYAGNGVHAVREIDQSMFPPEAEPIPAALRPSVQEPGMSSSAVAADSGSTIDVLVVYTPLARVAAGETADAIQALIALAVSETNSTYQNSGIDQRLNLVHTAEVNYTEGDMTNALYQLTSTTDGIMDEVHSLRNTYCADEVVLIVATGAYCGISWVMSYVSAGFESHAFAVVLSNCAAGYFSFGHELGHNMGAQHDWFVSSATLPYPYSHGYVNTVDRWRTVMAYNDACSSNGFNCTRIPYWSNPDVTYGGAPTGVPEGEAGAADNRKTLNTTAFTVANFRQSCAGSPPAAAVPMSPTGIVNDTTPTYIWSSASDSTTYYLAVTGTGGSVLQTSYTSEEVCFEDTCSVTPAAALVAGDYTWKIQTWNSFGYGPWSFDTSFTVKSGGPAGDGGIALNKILMILLDLLDEEN